ncbi:unnamed protein product [Knipowitschia caucasica]|uniref:Uncharacterized protein n=1 Tax=Knipowitschia caucasica TaxID=637954 RepID=A0AAV2JZA3_KNICA
MSEKLEYLENQSRQNNIRIYGVKEGLEGDDIIGFVLAEKLEILPENIQIAATHRSLGQRPTGENVAPRSMVVRFIQWNMRHLENSQVQKRDQDRQCSYLPLPGLL